MVATIINNSDKNLQAYMAFTGKNKENPRLNNFQYGQITGVGAQNAADINIIGEGEYIYAAMWKISDDGLPDSWLLYDKTTNEIVNKNFNTFKGGISGNNQTGWVLTVASESNTSKLIIYISIAIIVLFLLLGLILGGYLLFKRSTITNYSLLRSDSSVNLF